jgi:hypothetical protein
MCVVEITQNTHGKVSPCIWHTHKREASSVLETLSGSKFRLLESNGTKLLLCVNMYQIRRG